jgi:hypothetical protein
MSVQKIEGFLYSCDKCRVEHRADGMTGHYTQSTPPNWMSLNWWIGECSHRGDVLLCPSCSVGIKLAIDNMRDSE